VSVRRIVLDKYGRARSLIYQHNDALIESEHSSKVIIVAGGTIESARLLLLSASERYPDGIGSPGHVGKHLMFHHMRVGHLHYKDYLYPGRFGGITGQSQQFHDPHERGKHGGIHIAFSSDAVNPYHYSWNSIRDMKWKRGSQIVKELEPMRHLRNIVLTAESIPSSQKYVTLSEKRDRFGDRYAHVHYEPTEFDYESFHFARKIFNRFKEATSADDAELWNANQFNSGWHHMGTCRMGHDIHDSVVDQFGKIHGTSNLFVVGGSNFVGTGTVNPTLTMVALAIRSAAYILDQAL